MKNLIYIIFVILYVILLLDFVTLSHVQFWLDIYIAFIFIFIIYRLLHSFYTFVFIFIIVTTHHLCNICIYCLAIYSLMNLSYHIWLLHLIIIFDIHCCYLWDFSLYFVFNCYCSIFSIVFTLILMQHFLYIDIWLSFSWSAHFEEAYRKVLNTV